MALNVSEPAACAIALVVARGLHTPHVVEQQLQRRGMLPNARRLTGLVGAALHALDRSGALGIARTRRACCVARAGVDRRCHAVITLRGIDLRGRVATTIAGKPGLASRRPIRRAIRLITRTVQARFHPRTALTAGGHGCRRLLGRTRRQHASQRAERKVGGDSHRWSRYQHSGLGAPGRARRKRGATWVAPRPHGSERVLTGNRSCTALRSKCRTCCIR